MEAIRASVKLNKQKILLVIYSMVFLIILLYLENVVEYFGAQIYAFKITRQSKSVSTPENTAFLSMFNPMLGFI